MLKALILATALFLAVQGTAELVRNRGNLEGWGVGASYGNWVLSPAKDQFSQSVNSNSAWAYSDRNLSTYGDIADDEEFEYVFSCSFPFFPLKTALFFCSRSEIGFISGQNRGKTVSDLSQIETSLLKNTMVVMKLTDTRVCCI